MAAVVSDLPGASDGFYTPWRVKHLLRELVPAWPFPTVRRPEPEPNAGKRTISRPVWEMEDAICQHADLVHAMAQLPQFTRMICHKAYVEHEPDTHIARILGCDRETVRRHREDGVERIAELLGWEGKRPAPKPRPAKSPTVWRSEAICDLPAPGQE